MSKNIKKTCRPLCSVKKNFITGREETHPFFESYYCLSYAKKRRKKTIDYAKNNPLKDPHTTT